jgi:hypothetical protein
VQTNEMPICNEKEKERKRKKAKSKTALGRK